MPISIDECAPYLSTTLLRIEKTPAPSVSALREAIVSQLNKNSESRRAPPLRRTIHRVDRPIFRKGAMDVAWLHYSEARPPAWYIGKDLKEERHHVVFLARKNGLVALTCSDAAFRASIVDEIRKRPTAPLNRLKVLTAKQINDAFVGNRVRTLWLSGAHPRSATKADSKILAGIELEIALNPLEDQSYYFSSVRSTLNKAALAVDAGPSVVIGASPRNAKVWLGPSKNWSAFIDRVEALIDAAAQAIAKPSQQTSPLPILAHPMEGLAGASAPYDMAIILPEAISVGESNEVDPWLHEFCDAVRFEIKPEAGSPSFEAEVFWGRQSYGNIKYEFSAGSDSTPEVKTTASGWNADAEYQEAIRSICERADLLTVYYDTGHTFSGGLFYETQFRDARFLDWEWVKLAGFDVGAEKPLNGKKLMIENIGTANDESLFGFVAKHWPNYLNGGVPTGWLICDDGAMESADFIHFNENVNPPQLTLVHVKGSGSTNVKRKLSVSDYEVVVGQAVKNLRYLDRSHIHEKLSANKDSKIGAAVWRDGKRQNDRKAVLQILKGAGTNMTKTVCVFQPSARRSEVLAIGKKIEDRDLKRPDVRRLQQLDALLLAARAECLGLGASFHVIGEDDTV